MLSFYLVPYTLTRSLSLGGMGLVNVAIFFGEKFIFLGLDVHFHPTTSLIKSFVIQQDS